MGVSFYALGEGGAEFRKHRECFPELSSKRPEEGTSTHWLLSSAAEGYAGDLAPGGLGRSPKADRHLLEVVHLSM